MPSLSATYRYFLTPYLRLPVCLPPIRCSRVRLYRSLSIREGLKGHRASAVPHWRKLRMAQKEWRGWKSPCFRAVALPELAAHPDEHPNVARSATHEFWFELPSPARLTFLGT